MDGLLYAILLIGCTGFGWNTTTAYNMSASLEYYISNYRSGIGPHILGLILVILVGVIIFGGEKRIGVLSSILVPVMAVLYIVFSMVCIVCNIGELLMYSQPFSRVPLTFVLLQAALQAPVSYRVSNEAYFPMKPVWEPAPTPQLQPPASIRWYRAWLR